MPDASLTLRLRKAVSLRARYLCEYCRSQEAYSPDAFSCEHIFPRSRGGTTTLDNLALACQGCNGHKGKRIQAPDPETGEVTLLFHPRQQKWRGHFAWNEDTTHILGLTPTGRATLITLKMNRDRLLNLRLVLHQVGQHPPDEEG